MMLPGPLPQPLHGQANGSGCIGLLGDVNLDVTVPQVPGKKGAWLVPRVFLVAASGLYCHGDHGCSGETGTVVLNLGAVAAEQMLCVEQRHLRRFFCSLSVCWLPSVSWHRPSCHHPSAFPLPFWRLQEKYASPL